MWFCQRCWALAAFTALDRRQLSSSSEKKPLTCLSCLLPASLTQGPGRVQSVGRATASNRASHPSSSVAAGVCVWRINTADNPALQTKAAALYRDQLCRGMVSQECRPNKGSKMEFEYVLNVKRLFLKLSRGPGYLDSEVLPPTGSLLENWNRGNAWNPLNCPRRESAGAQVSFVKVFVPDAQHHLCVARTKSTLFICPERTMDDESPTQQTPKTAPPEAADWSSWLRKQSQT